MRTSTLPAVDPWRSPAAYAVFACADTVRSREPGRDACGFASCLGCVPGSLTPSVSSTPRNSQEEDCTHGEGRNRSGSFGVQLLTTNNSSVAIPSPASF